MAESGMLPPDQATREQPRVVRGGSWNNNHENARAGFRNRNNPDNRNTNIGFRCVLAAHDPLPFSGQFVAVAWANGG
jgi:formylglycine-generating enzyme required for sulfatase activity